MSTHEVRIVKVGPVTPIEGADSIVLTMIWDYPCVVKRGQFQEGDLAAFIEPDTKVPLNRIEFSFLDTGKGRDFERITTRRFRGQQSYGLLLPAPEGMVEGDNAWDHFGVERYEPPPPRGSLGGPTDAMSGLCETGPEVNAPVYDLENIRKNNNILTPDDDVIYTEKLHGCVSGDTVVETDIGRLEISKLVDEKIPCKVLSFNHESGKPEYQKIVNWLNSGVDPDAQWYEITLEDDTTVKVTGNHPIFIPALNAYRRADQLVVGDLLLTNH